MPIAQSMFDKSKMRQQRNQDCKAINVAKCVSKKEQQKWLEGELPDNIHGMKLAVHSHLLFLLKVKHADFSSLPAPPTTEKHEIVSQVGGHLGNVPEDLFNEPSTQVQSQGFQSYCKNELHKLELKQSALYWESLWQHLFNQLISMVIYHTPQLQLVSAEYHSYFSKKDLDSYRLVGALMEQYFNYLKI
ncbi:hypothetical protein O181_065088 [Austropuccinia psidii MF-1]|uniref:Uncharacterized protein n=1 Tax=Austropuccinia psidii MF-1 TaxID=1389203 RepID=A0A9Q3EUQ8_9BASI|nr:hypothetical protein [Austropuccinia psidii MF-1]